MKTPQFSIFARLISPNESERRKIGLRWADGLVCGEENSVTALADFDEVVEQTHRALAEFVKGNPEPMKMLFSHKEDVTLANPLSRPPARGWEQVAATMERAASFYRDGEVSAFDSVARNATLDLAYIVEVERYKAKIAGSKDLAPWSLRVTSIFRPEENTWRIVHRHADRITTV